MATPIATATLITVATSEPVPTSIPRTSLASPVSEATSTATSECSWANHCEGARCEIHDDCSDALACIQGICTNVDEPDDSECSWAGHCEGDTCAVDGDCDGDLACRNDVCATVPGGTPTDKPSSPPAGSSTQDPASSPTVVGGAQGINSESSGGLSTGTKIGVGVGVGAAVLLMLCIALLYRRVSKAKKARDGEMQDANVSPTTSFPATAQYHPAAPASSYGAAPPYAAATPASELPDTPKPHEIDSYPKSHPLTASELGSEQIAGQRPQWDNAVELPTGYNRNSVEPYGGGTGTMDGQGTMQSFGQMSSPTYDGGDYGTRTWDDVSPQSGKGGYQRQF